MTKGQLEDIISNKMSKFAQEHFGRGAEQVKTFIIKDMVIVRFKNVLTPVERQLALSDHGRSLIKELRYELELLVRPKFEKLMQELTNANIKTIHHDISTKTGERIDVFILDKDIESSFNSKTTE